MYYVRDIIYNGKDEGLEQDLQHEVCINKVIKGLQEDSK